MANIKTFNTTLEKVDLGIHGTTWAFHPRVYTLVPELCAQMLENEYKDYGIVVIREGDNIKKKEIEGLSNYINRLENIIRSELSHQDDSRRIGATVIQSQRYLQAIKWKEEIVKKIGNVVHINKIPSFFDEEIQIKEDEKAPKKKKVINSFEETNIAQEVAI